MRAVPPGQKTGKNKERERERVRREGSMLRTVFITTIGMKEISFSSFS